MKEIKQARILPFLRHLNQKYDVFLPIKKGKDWVFEKFNSEMEYVNTHPVLTILPPKKFFLPQGEIINYTSQNGMFYNIKSKPTVIFGINSFDISALTLLDQIMTRPHNDPYYQQRRKNTILIAIGPERINIANNGYDLFLEKYGEAFVALAGSVKGEAFLELKYFERSQKQPKKILSFKDPLFNKLDKIQTALNKSFGKKIWEKVAQTCFGCGICAYVCPLCYCHEYEDSFSTPDVLNSSTSGVNTTSGVCTNCRKRQWDACFLPNFFAVAGHNFRENLPERIYNWYYHKFVRMPKEFGPIGCVDCGRCIEYCPAKINFKEVLRELTKNV
ncbi:hypothetical protein A3F08_02310 [Candidatus Berkelbacteria bacterium RIFCSPHIGHO2_12_FULL_36_9]|uniref:4Fe-4S ferredoxin-type domain-containing protein n=1 Tax=Candidatus Berkelbacteria bacterium RIFCSPHIGHO2_12_FULL_36_9 TaxID=1797469 RepID=A0A1F5EFH3_9BACT|nr:MAG: hypothetical protein A3F08_02310 [Candidatus Berkelbacteria bacterium RIFCSPHIGHO2_12_FULL_36_9]